uniref:Putative conserved secreted protein n=1 Tax=Culex tarsalis TaxID=7177 RepID=A0A1Q3FSG7_CULTA
MQPITVFCFFLVCSIGVINCKNNKPQKDDIAIAGFDAEKMDLVHGVDRIELDHFPEQQRQRRATCNIGNCSAACARRQFRGSCVKDKCRCY